jgi:hypothetical protein
LVKKISLNHVSNKFVFICVFCGFIQISLPGRWPKASVFFLDSNLQNDHRRQKQTLSTAGTNSVYTFHFTSKCDIRNSFDPFLCYNFPSFVIKTERVSFVSLKTKKNAINIKQPQRFSTHRQNDKTKLFLRPAKSGNGNETIKLDRGYNKMRLRQVSLFYNAYLKST